MYAMIDQSNRIKAAAAKLADKLLVFAPDGTVIEDPTIEALIEQAVETIGTLRRMSGEQLERIAELEALVKSQAERIAAQSELPTVHC